MQTVSKCQSGNFLWLSASLSTSEKNNFCVRVALFMPVQETY
jgi:hypothetical protein